MNITCLSVYLVWQRPACSIQKKTNKIPLGFVTHVLFKYLFHFRQDALHHPFDKVVAVMGMDMTLGYFYKLAVEQLPVCEHENIRCFIMDDRGYLIAHKGKHFY